MVNVRFDPVLFSLELPLFLVVLISVFVGLLTGVFYSWKSSWGWHNRVKALRRQKSLLEAELSQKGANKSRELPNQHHMV